MNEWTEQEEQQIIERAKTGDPEANYALSLWALHRGEEEPDEPRWNRLAAKCLVKAAQAGYGPAKEQMAALLNQSGQAPAPTPAPARQSAPAPDPTPIRRHAADSADQDMDADVDDSDVKRAAPIRRSASPRRAPRPTASARRPAARRRPERDDAEEGFDVDQASWDDGYDDEEDVPVRKGRRGGFAPARREEDQDGSGKWGDDKWRRLELICVAVCAVLLVIIAAMIISGKSSGDKNPSGASIPPAGEVGAAGSGTVVSDYPDEATKNAIMAAELDIFPAQEDYVTGPTNGTVSVSSEYLRVRKGPNTTYDELAQLPNESSVSILATKNDWDLVLYQGGEGAVYGWCNSGYVIITAGAAAGATAAAATDAPGDAVG